MNRPNVLRTALVGPTVLLLGTALAACGGSDERTVTREPRAPRRPPGAPAPAWRSPTAPAPTTSSAA
ncbi:hypothetical protein [Nocardioides sp.]|uniref:hypothetical protein n=1 Tax=Nocardioides sp. TaxID=35761 RepID=UPI0037836E08